MIIDKVLERNFFLLGNLIKTGYILIKRLPFYGENLMKN